MRKKKEHLEKILDDVIDETIEEEFSEKKIVAPLTISFPNEDLNKLVEKINEIIKQL